MAPNRKRPPGYNAEQLDLAISWLQNNPGHAPHWLQNSITACAKSISEHQARLCSAPAAAPSLSRTRLQIQDGTWENVPTEALIRVVLAVCYKIDNHGEDIRFRLQFPYEAQEDRLWNYLWMDDELRLALLEHVHATGAGALPVDTSEEFLADVLEEKFRKVGFRFGMVDVLEWCDAFEKERKWKEDQEWLNDQEIPVISAPAPSRLRTRSQILNTYTWENLPEGDFIAVVLQACHNIDRQRPDEAHRRALEHYLDSGRCDELRRALLKHVHATGEGELPVEDPPTLFERVVESDSWQNWIQSLADVLEGKFRKVRFGMVEVLEWCDTFEQNMSRCWYD